MSAYLADLPGVRCMTFSFG